MKREGRQHGVVRSYPILPTPLSRQRRYVKTVESASVAGLFTKVSTKPTNQSKFTGKCGTPQCHACHTPPVYKSKEKAKGTMKLRSVGAYLAGYGSYDDDTFDDYDYDYDDDTNYNDEFGSDGVSTVREEVIGTEDEDESVSYCDDHGDHEWYLVGHFQ